MARGLTEEPEDNQEQPELRELASMLYALLRTVQEINDKLPAPAKPERPVNGL
jgi:hypothetical protein